MNTLTKTASFLALAAASCLPLATSAHAADTSLEARLTRLEAQLARIEQRLGETVSADELAPTLKEFSDLTKNLGWDGKSALTVVKAGGKEKTLSLGGFVQFQGEFGDSPDDRYGTSPSTFTADRFLLRRARLTVKGTFQEFFDFTLQSDFGAASIGTGASARAQLTDAFVNFNRYPAANIQVGQFKSAFGYEQLLSDTKTLFAERSLPNDKLTVGRQIGVALAGTVADKKLNYTVGVFNSTGVNTGGNDNDQMMVAGRLSGQLWGKGTDKLTLGTNAYRSKDAGTPIVTRTGTGIDAQLTLGRFETAAEYLHLLSDKVTGTDVKSDGWYAWAGYFIVPKSLQAVLRYETYDSNKATAATTSKSWVAGLNYYLKGDDLKLSVNYTYGDPAGALEWQGRLITRLQVIF